ncbi:MAG TPA: hypothetical protein VKO20_06310 [Desulfosalsimonadaceae bacterium]|nr:hypothetical protein [Desulfosalsimonadaceae bacterium]
MKRIVEKLAALALTFSLLAALILWLGLGILLTRLPATDPVFARMNQQLVLEWFLGPEKKPWWIVVWFIGFCLLNMGILLNLLACCATNLLNRLAFPNRLKNLLLLVIHILVILIMLAHAANMGIGYKHAGIRMPPGETFKLQNGGTLRLADVGYALPTKYLLMDPHEARRDLTRERIDISRNYARVQWTGPNGRTAGGKLHRLQPLRIDSLRITLNRFYLAAKSPEPRVGAILTVARNPVHEAFFLVYAVTIACLMLYAVLQRQNPGRRLAARKQVPISQSDHKGEDHAVQVP